MHLCDKIFLTPLVRLFTLIYSVMVQKQNVLKLMSIQQYLRDYAYCYNC